MEWLSSHPAFVLLFPQSATSDSVGLIATAPSSACPPDEAGARPSQPLAILTLRVVDHGQLCARGHQLAAS
jgi:hypothetical protein